MGEKGMGKTSKELLEKISAETAWALTAKFLITFAILRGSKTLVPLLGKDEGIFAPIWGLEKFEEINSSVWGDQAIKQFYRWVKETFNIPVGDAIGAVKLVTAAFKLQSGPEWELEYPEVSRERAIVRATKCVYWERYNELGVNPEVRPCLPICEVKIVETAQAINPKLICKLKKGRPRGDPYCEWVYKFKE